MHRIARTSSVLVSIFALVTCAVGGCGGPADDGAETSASEQAFSVNCGEEFAHKVWGECIGYKLESSRRACIAYAEADYNSCCSFPGSGCSPMTIESAS